MPSGGTRYSTVKRVRVPRNASILNKYLFGMQEVRVLLNLSKSRAAVTVLKDGFPMPLDTLASGRVWEASSVIRWAIDTNRMVVTDDVSS